MNTYKSLIRPILFAIDPETSHHLTRPILRSAFLSGFLGRGPVRNPRLEVRISGLVLPNPIGVAPGFDKDCEMTAGLSRLGFGYLVPGTVTLEPRAGNPRPRIVRVTAQEAMINCMGLPNKGLQYFSAQIAKRRSSVPVIASFEAPDIPGYVHCAQVLEPFADALELNPRCNNNQDDAGDFLKLHNFDRLVAAVTRDRRKPLFIKINNYYTEAERQERLESVERALYYGINTFSMQSVTREKDPRLSLGMGNSSGRPLLRRTLEVVRDIWEVSKGKAVIRAKGGIFTGEEAFQAIAAGATTVEVLTGIVYEGWGIARQMNAELMALMERERIPSLGALRGSAAPAAAG